MAVNPELLLFIEPENEPSDKPIIDELTMKMTASFRKAKKENAYFGWHNCSCGANSGNHDYSLNNGEMTNANCIHYLAYHRDEISQEQLDRVEKLNDGKEIPNNDEIERDREKWHDIINPNKKKKKKAMARQEYLDSLK
jgi:hypothetical protein